MPALDRDGLVHQDMLTEINRAHTTAFGLVFRLSTCREGLPTKKSGSLVLCKDRGIDRA